jgi:hypothetical protein
MHGKVNFAECTSTQHLTYTIEAYLSLRSIIILFEGVMNIAHYKGNFLRSWRKLFRLIFTAFVFYHFLCSKDFPIKSMFVDVGGHISDFLFLFFRDEWSFLIFKVEFFIAS